MHRYDLQLMVLIREKSNCPSQSVCHRERMLAAIARHSPPLSTSHLSKPEWTGRCIRVATEPAAWALMSVFVKCANVGFHMPSRFLPAALFSKPVFSEYIKARQSGVILGVLFVPLVIKSAFSHKMAPLAGCCWSIMEPY